MQHTANMSSGVIILTASGFLRKKTYLEKTKAGAVSTQKSVLKLADKEREQQDLRRNKERQTH